MKVEIDALEKNKTWDLVELPLGKKLVGWRVTVLLVYANDIVVTGGDLQGMNALKRCLLQEFEVKQLGRSGESIYAQPKKSTSSSSTLNSTILKRSIDDRRSTSSYCTFLGGNLVTWRNKKQNVVTRSRAEVEFRVMALGVCELLWLKIILEDLKIASKGPMKLYCDNKSAIDITHNPVQHDRTSMWK
ncbi:Retrovirus-related Pol polyprotein from transposon RE2 [Vitis vinifera]|uniref:Retrovirus-related Pol polyprotein from transposon RE2 n=1 Tax=Vitis vinifera TaxID=29760 RepID=A0A438H9S7_VITVI|nr:Retrovirus-related Pol polyprotein from transposon RE2 [Vitis vinifera]